MQTIKLLTVALALGVTTSVAAEQPAPPSNPKGWGEVVKFGATEDHNNYPGPGNVVGGVRHDLARNENGPGVAAEIQPFMNEFFGIPVADPLEELVP